MTRSSRNALGVLATFFVGLLSAGAASADAIFVTDGLTLATAGATTQVGEYDTSGAVINPSLITALGSDPVGLAVSGSNLFEADETYPGIVSEYTTGGAFVNSIAVNSYAIGLAASGADMFVLSTSSFGGPDTVGEYTTSLATVNASLISGLSSAELMAVPRVPGVPAGITVSGSDLFVANSSGVGEYTTSGAVVNASLITGTQPPTGIVVVGSDLFVTNFFAGTVGEYTTSGAVVNPSLISGLSLPVAIAALGSDLFVLNLGGPVGEYTTSGTVVNADLIPISLPLAFGGDIAVAATPEPSTFLLVSAALLVGLVWRFRRRARPSRAKV